MEATLDPILIADLDVFQGLADGDLCDILRHARARRSRKGAAIFRQGEEAESFFVLLDGRLKVVQTTPDGQQIVVRFIHPGELFGIAAAIGRQHYPGTALVAVESVALAWPQPYWQAMVARYPTVAVNALRVLGGRLEEQRTRLREMATQRVERRVAQILLRLLRQAGRKTADGVEISFPISRQDLAEMTGTTLFTVSRVISAWDQAGVTASERQHLVVRQPHTLLCIAEETSSSANVRN